MLLLRNVILQFANYKKNKTTSYHPERIVSIKKWKPNFQTTNDTPTVLP
jgi:hypothetical protein